jgi:CcmD family protein
MKRIAMLALYALLLTAPVLAQAQPPPPATPPTAAAQDGFVPVDSPIGQEQIPAARFVSIAYGFIWVVLFAYMWSVRSRLARVEREMAEVSQRLPARKP